MREGTWKTARTVQEQQRLLDWLGHQLGADRVLTSIDRATVDLVTDNKLGAGAGPRTVNACLEVLRAVLRAAVGWGWLDAAPPIRMLRLPVRRARWLSVQEARRLLQELPPHLAQLAAFTLETGLRRSNVTGLTWDQVDLNEGIAWIHADQAKGRKAIPVPLSDTAKRILLDARQDLARHCFTYRGRPIKQTSTRAWRLAKERARISGFRWHDLRHTWASWHALAGTPMHVLQELGGWSSPAMLRVYVHLSTQHLRQHVDQLHAWRHGPKKKRPAGAGLTRRVATEGLRPDNRP